MADSSFTGASLETALRDGSLVRKRETSIVCMVKPSEREGHIEVTTTSCESWVELSTDLVEEAKVLTYRGCKDHEHPVVRLTFKDPKSVEGKAFATLLGLTRTRFPALSPPRRPMSVASRRRSHLGGFLSPTGARSGRGVVGIAAPAKDLDGLDGWDDTWHQIADPCDDCYRDYDLCWQSTIRNLAINTWGRDPGPWTPNNSGFYSQVLDVFDDAIKLACGLPRDTCLENCGGSDGLGDWLGGPFPGFD